MHSMNDRLQLQPKVKVVFVQNNILVEYGLNLPLVPNNGNCVTPEDLMGDKILLK